MKFALLTAIVFTLPTGLLMAEDYEIPAEMRSWSGQWTNKKFGTSGPLKCVATHEGNGIWNATFTGTFKGDPFEYKTKFQSKMVRGRTLVGGTSKVRGHDYKWQGNVNGKMLIGNYTSSVGYYGQFRLKETP